jgi:hypothetical protein
MSQSGHQRRSALITVPDKCLLYSESDQSAALPRSVEPDFMQRSKRHRYFDHLMGQPL